MAQFGNLETEKGEGYQKEMRGGGEQNSSVVAMHKKRERERERE